MKQMHTKEFGMKMLVENWFFKKNFFWSIQRKRNESSDGGGVRMDTFSMLESLCVSILSEVRFGDWKPILRFKNSSDESMKFYVHLTVVAGCFPKKTKKIHSSSPFCVLPLEHRRRYASNEESMPMLDNLYFVHAIRFHFWGFCSSIFLLRSKSRRA